MSDTPLQREFADRDALIVYLANTFADVVGTDDAVAAMVGGRQAALQRLAQIGRAHV